MMCPRRRWCGGWWEGVLGAGRVPLLRDPAIGHEVLTEGQCDTAQGRTCVSTPTEAGQAGADFPCRGWVTAPYTAFHSETTASHGLRESGIQPELC